MNTNQKLSEPFPVEEVEWKPQTISGNRAMAVAYVDARVVMDRLDNVLGQQGWQDSYELLPGGQVVCRLSCLLDGAWITKEDVGGQSDQPDVGDRMKAAFSDALKRAAVKFGVGRYLYSIPVQWADFDPKTKKLVNSPKLPAWAIPAKPVAPASKASGSQLSPAEEYLVLLRGCQSEADINYLFPSCKQLPEADRKRCWHETRKMAEANDLVFDEKLVKFVFRLKEGASA